jgi:hypothetical protein
MIARRGGAAPRRRRDFNEVHDYRGPVNAQRRSRIVALGLIVLSTWLVPMVATAVASKESGNVSFRAILCFAPLSGTPTFSGAAALPECRAPYRLTAKNLDIKPNDSAQGFTSKTVEPDPRFLDFPVSPRVLNSSVLLLPGIPGEQSERFVVGPARLTSASFKSAKAVKQSLGQWVVTYRLTTAGSLAMDALARSQFHAYIAIVANGEVYSAPIIQPSQSHFASFNGGGEVSGSFTKSQAEALAQQMHP